MTSPSTREDRAGIADAAGAILADHAASDAEALAAQERAGWNAPLWTALADSGFTLVGVAEEAGGSGGGAAEACAVLYALGRHAGAAPVAETGLLAGWALAAAGLDLPAGPATVPAGRPGAQRLELHRGAGGLRVSGRLDRVPWAEQSERLVAAVPDPHSGGGTAQVVSVPLDSRGARISPGRNLAGESRDTVELDGVPLTGADAAPAPDGLDAAALFRRGALARSAAIAGALERVSELTVAHTAVREQFGRPLARFQAVQRHVVRVAEATQSAAIAAEAAALTTGTGAADLFDAAAAKITAGRSATDAARASHQAHGAIGMTLEYELGRLTRRLWAWRDEFGSEGYWSRDLGARVAAAGPDALWPRIAAGVPS
ncbi:acyl-CoA dehydrogenase family protein [Nocardiopsis coralliicola]